MKKTHLSLIHISEPTRRTPISYAVFCLKKNSEWLVKKNDNDVGNLGHPLYFNKPDSLGQLSCKLGIPSLSKSGNLHPPLDFNPLSLGQLSKLSLTPSPSESGHPFWELEPGEFGHISFKSFIPSPSESGHPLSSVKPGWSGHLSFLSGTPSPSESPFPKLNFIPTTCWRLLYAFFSFNDL